MRRSRLAPRSGEPDCRGQTFYDYAVGISVFVLTVGLVLGLLPGVIASITGEGTAVEKGTSTRVAGQIVGNLSVADTESTLNHSEVTALFAFTEDELRSRFGLNQATHINLTLTDLEGETHLKAAGATASTEDALSAARVITLAPPGPCSPACRLTVQIW